jgi:hypothetical protein
MLNLNELDEKHSKKCNDTQLNKMQYKNDNYKNLPLHYAIATM